MLKNKVKRLTNFKKGKFFLKAIACLSLSVCMSLSNLLVFAGGVNDVIQNGNHVTLYVSHAMLEKMVNQGTSTKKSALTGMSVLSSLLGTSKVYKYLKNLQILDTFWDVSTGLGGLKNCLKKSAESGNKGCKIEYLYDVYSTIPEYAYMLSCEPQK